MPQTANSLGQTSDDIVGDIRTNLGTKSAIPILGVKWI